MEEDLELFKHVCKFCSKSFPCGRSLGGHMRSHIININMNNKTNSNSNSNSNTSQKKPIMCVDDSQHDSMGYVLRKKKKTTSESDSPPPDHQTNHKVCKNCGKQFFSWKSLFAHIKCHHSHKEAMSFSFYDDQPDSWIAAAADDSLSDNETSAAPSKGRRSKRRTRSGNATNNFSSVSEIDQIEEEEVAMSLMMLSRDVTNWGALNSVAESSDNTSDLILEFKKKKKKKNQKQNSAQLSASGISRNNNSSVHHVTPDWKSSKRMRRLNDSVYSLKRSKFECTTCNRIFDSYQALGGHRASHKKTKSCFASTSRAESKEDQNSIDTEDLIQGKIMINHIPFNHRSDDDKAAAAAAEEMISRKKGDIGSGTIRGGGGGHECPICLKVFSSGQALGGHKRSHLLSEAAGENHTLLIPKPKPIPETREFLDLNMPAPVEEDPNPPREGFNPPWWQGSSHKHETLVGLI